MLNTHIHAVASMQCRGISTLATYLHSFRNSLHMWTLWLLTIFTFQAQEHSLTSIIKLNRAQYFLIDANEVCLHAELSEDRSVGAVTVMFTVCVGGEGVNFVNMWISYWAKDNPNIELNLSLSHVFVPSAPSLSIRAHFSLSEQPPLQKVFVRRQSRGFIPLALTSKWSSALSDTRRHMANQSKEGFSCCSSGVMTQRSRLHVGRLRGFLLEPA